MQTCMLFMDEPASLVVARPAEVLSNGDSLLASLPPYLMQTVKVDNHATQPSSSKLPIREPHVQISRLVSAAFPCHVT